MTASNLLAIETSSGTGSIALAVGDTVTETTISTPREQTPRILAIVDNLLSDAGLKLGDLDALVFGRGPGSFTGLRVAAAVAQGLSFSSGVPIVSVSSLAALAQRGFSERDAAQASSDTDAVTEGGAVVDSNAAIEHALCCVDARMGEVYWATFSWADGIAHAESEERIGLPESVNPPDAPFVALGDGFAAYSEILAGIVEGAVEVDPAIRPRAKELIVLAAREVAAGQFVPLEAALPVYLREADAWRRV